MLSASGVLAHQGGWDEALVVVVPVGLFGALFWAATVRASGRSRGPGRSDRS